MQSHQINTFALTIQADFNENPLEGFSKEEIADNSIPSDIDPEMTALTIDQTLLSMGQRILARAGSLPGPSSS